MKEYHLQRAEELGLPIGTGKRYSAQDIESFIEASATHKTKWQELENMCQEFDDMDKYLDSLHTTIPRIIAPGIVFWRTYKPAEGLSEEELAELHDMLFTGSRFMIERVRELHKAFFTSSDPESS